MDHEIISELKRYKSEDCAILRIHRRIIKVKELEGEEWMQDAQEFIRVFLDEMKSVDRDFKTMCRRLVVAGSVSDRLRLSDSNEIDFNFEISLPQNYVLDVQENRTEKGFYALKLKSHPKKLTEIQTRILNWTDDDGYILQDVFSSWMQSIVDRTLLKLTTNILFPFKVSASSSGPARTVSVYRGPVFLFDADLVPVIITEKKIFVPKPSRSRQTDNKFFLRSFRDQEHHLMFNQHYLKPTIRLMKKYRDSHPELKNLNSYYIKMAFILEFTTHPYIWKGYGITGLFIYMLKTILEKHLIPGEMLCYWTGRNILNNTAGLENMAGVFKRSIERIENEFDTNPHVVAEEILSDENELEYFRSIL